VYHTQDPCKGHSATTRKMVLGQQSESACLNLLVNKLWTASFGRGSTMIGFLYDMPNNNQGPTLYEIKTQ
jgi:hypothetical protein